MTKELHFFGFYIRIYIVLSSSYSFASLFAFFHVFFSPFRHYIFLFTFSLFRFVLWIMFCQCIIGFVYLSPFYFNTKSIYHAVYNLLSRLSSQPSTATTVFVIIITATKQQQKPKQRIKNYHFFWLTDWLKVLLLWNRTTNSSIINIVAFISKGSNRISRRSRKKLKRTRKSSPDLCQLICSKHAKSINSSFFRSNYGCFFSLHFLSLYTFNFNQQNDETGSWCRFVFFLYHCCWACCLLLSFVTRTMSSKLSHTLHFNTYNNI